MLIYNFIKPLVCYAKAFFLFFSVGLNVINAQNTLHKVIDAYGINTIVIQGNQIFNITVKTHKVKCISITSIIDGEYQDNYQIAAQQKDGTLTLGIEFMTFEPIPDDKRNAHKLIAATLAITIPEELQLDIFSDIGSANVKGSYKSLAVELLSGFCQVNANAKYAMINTIDGDINIITNRGEIRAFSKYGKVIVDVLESSDFIWKIQSIKGDISVVKQE